MNFHREFPGEAEVSMADARRRSQESREQEFAALLVLQADWWFDPSQALAFAYFRRTWSAGLFLEFTAGHPMAVRSGIRGNLRATLRCLAEIALTTGGEWVWWEATGSSFPKYDWIVGYDNWMRGTEPRVKDVFLVKAATLQSLLDVERKPRVSA